jgi:methionyl-tRNA formyltransferase
LIGTVLRAGAVERAIDNGLAPKAILASSEQVRVALCERLERVYSGSIEVCRRSDVLGRLEAFAPHLVFTIGWPYILEDAVVDGPWRLLNVHPTLLPKYRGLNPWYDIIANGEDESGVTVHQIDYGVDSGPILRQEKFALTVFDTYRSLRAKVLELEPEVVVGAIREVLDDSPEYIPQDEDEATVYRDRRTPADSEIDPGRSLTELYDAIRAADPERFPAFFFHEGQKVCVKLWRPNPPEDAHPESL